MVRININKKWEGEIVKIQGKKVVNKSTWETGLIVEGQAKELCPVDYGYLKASINTQSVEQGTELGQVVSKKTESVTQVVGSKTKYNDVHKASHKSFFENMPERFQKIKKPIKENEVLVGTAVEYAPHIEFGTINMDSQPFLRPAADLANGKVLEIVKVNSKKYFLWYLIEHEQYLRSRGK